MGDQEETNSPATPHFQLASPTVRTGRTWRFNLPIPQGVKTISLVATDAGAGRFKDVADWVDAGFIVF